ncbi:unnamed protein product [Thelazia callipaeda]|uniref:Major sperm protein n=1 Tax=Thelazia callipaeda TaxID=103827 RepID=A0A0N5CJE1_THECL|nr:unnamed protein product [Thelazia callipaeda]
MTKAMGDFALKLEPSERITYVGKKLGEEPCPTTLKITNPTSVASLFQPLHCFLFLHCPFKTSTYLISLSPLLIASLEFSCAILLDLDRQACKVKCTSNEMFRIRPPVFALKPGEEMTVKLTFNAGKTVPDSGKHYFAVYYIKATDENKAPRACWADHKGDPNGTKRLYVDFKKEDGEDKKEEVEKKDDEKKEGEDKKDDKKEGGEEKKDDEKKDEKGEEKKDEKKDDEKVGRFGWLKEDKKDEEKKDDEKEDKKEDEKKEDKK